MKVLDLRCSSGHLFEGWFGSEGDFLSQSDRGLIECPLCADRQVVRMPSAPRLNLSGAVEPARDASPRSDAEKASVKTEEPAVRTGHPGQGDVPAPKAADMSPEARAAAHAMQSLWVQAVRHAIATTEDVGPRFAQEARRIHHGESDDRPIRGQATPDEREALREEGIEVHALPIPPGWDGPVQ